MVMVMVIIVVIMTMVVILNYSDGQDEVIVSYDHANRVAQGGIDPESQTIFSYPKIMKMQ